MEQIMNKLKGYSLFQHQQIQKILRWIIFILCLTCGILFYLDF